MAATMAQMINLGIQFGVLILTIFGHLAFRKKKFSRHGQFMTIGFVMILVSFLLVMVPSLIMTYNTFGDPATPVFDWTSIVHIPFGIIGMALGALLVIRWARNDYRVN